MVKAPAGTNQELPGQPAEIIPFFHGQPADASVTWPEFIDLSLIPFQHGQPVNIIPVLPQFIVLHHVINVIVDVESVLDLAGDENDVYWF